MSKTAKGLVDYATAQLGKPYWWGCFGQTASASLYEAKKAQYPSYYTAADFQSQYGQRVHDCVGLIKGYRWSDTPNSAPKYSVVQDVAVRGLYDQCTKRGDIGSIPETPGVCVFMKDMGHVGVYIGGGEVIEAMGHAWGVVKTKLKGRGWAYWGMPGWIDYGESTSSSTETEGGGCEVELPVLQRGSKGNSVKALQLLLVGNGCSVGKDGADGDFGSNTHLAVLKYQGKKGLEKDGIVGPATWSALLK